MREGREGERRASGRAQGTAKHTKPATVVVSMAQPQLPEMQAAYQRLLLRIRGGDALTHQRVSTGGRSSHAASHPLIAACGAAVHLQPFGEPGRCRGERERESGDETFCVRPATGRHMHSVMLKAMSVTG